MQTPFLLIKLGRCTALQNGNSFFLRTTTGDKEKEKKGVSEFKMEKWVGWGDACFIM